MFREQRFRIDLIPFTLVLLVVGLAAIVAMHALEGRSGVFQTDPRVFKMLAAMALLAVAVWAIFPEYAGPDGLRGTDGIGRYHDVRWDEITDVRSRLGFIWIRHGRPGKGLCIPRFLANRQGFRGYVMRRAPQGNPLRTYLERH